MATMTKRLYALAGSLGMVERNNKDDPFHQLVHGITGKEHVSELTQKEAKAVENELLERMRLKNHAEKISVPQQNLVWRYIYRLCELDPTDAEPVDRLIGAINKILGKSASKRDPFRWVKTHDAEKLIEQLKRYVRSAERKSQKAGGG